MDCCVKAVDKKVTMVKNLMPCQPILWHEWATSWHCPSVCAGTLQRLGRSQKIPIQNFV